ncbi:glycosyltransferase [Chitinophaga silvatica]|uniref:Glycosyltransferase n=1 Tax=Chitinophaga silvatica TaxID=2282649 RepID=A0A3E1YD60_9BACT|nr:glycosyltransferase family 4 protein [Chitinophaga silvatica]RFS23954.1 glycosyltransferase [Chitinophaga silvatica]
MKNVLFFCSITSIGGAETNIIKLIKELTTKGYKVHLASLQNTGPMLDHCASDLISFTEIGLYYKTPKKSYNLYKQLLLKNKIDIVFNFGLRVELFSRTVSKSINPNIKVISNIRSTDDWRKFYHIWLDRITSKNVDKWVSNSEAGRQITITREKYPASKIEVIYNYIEVSRRQSNSPMRSDRISIGILANIKALKGYFDLIKVSKRLVEQGVPHKFICAGVDYTNGDFEKAISDMGVANNFELKGYIKDKDTFFEEIDIFILPSYLEGLPTCLLEAMAFSKPVICTNVGGNQELVHDKVNGFVHAPGDIKGFTNSITQLIDDPLLRDKFIDNGHKFIHERFEKSKCLAQWIAVIEE